MKRKAIIVGATSGMGRELANVLSEKDYDVYIAGRRIDLLQESGFNYKQIDVTDIDNTISNLNEMVLSLEGLDLLVISSGTGDVNKSLDFGIEKCTIDVNVIGFTLIADWGFRYFEKQQKGHLVAISSLAGLRGGADSPAYNATKAYQINYMEALSVKASKLNLPITITDIRPGFVDTAMAKGEGLFWVTPLNKAVGQLYKAIRNKKRIAYISKRWGFIACILKIIPFKLYNKI